MNTVTLSPLRCLNWPDVKIVYNGTYTYIKIFHIGNE